MIDQEFTSHIIKLLTATKGMSDWGEAKGLLDVEKVRLTVAARKEKAKELVDAGMSKRQAAEVLGVDESTVRADVRENPAQKAGKSRTPKPDKEPQNDGPIEESCIDCKDDEERWQRSLFMPRGALARAVKAGLISKAAVTQLSLNV